MMYILPEFSPAALDRWLRLPAVGRERVLSPVPCGGCGGAEVMRNVRGDLEPSRGIVLEGECVACGGRVCRVIEAGESSPSGR